MMKNPLLYVTAAVSLVALTSVAQARSSYDGSWDLLFVTQRGACDPTYNFSVNITDGFVTHPNLVRFRGYVARSGAVRASVTVHDKYASGSGRLSSNSGRGTWSGYFPRLGTEQHSADLTRLGLLSRDIEKARCFTSEAERDRTSARAVPTGAAP